MNKSRIERKRTGNAPAQGRPLCEDCGRPIPVKRLRANPFAVRCYACQDILEHSQHDLAVRDVCPICGHGLMWKPRGKRFSEGYRQVCTRYPECTFNVVATAS